MLNNRYNKNILEAVTQGSKVSGCPSRFLSLLKTTLFIAMIFINNSYSEDKVMNEFFCALDKINDCNLIIKIPYYKDTPETAEEASVRAEKEKRDMEDVKINKAEITNGKYWVNKQWIYK